MQTFDVMRQRVETRNHFAKKMTWVNFSDLCAEPYLN
jgi:hypothetical protein